MERSDRVLRQPRSKGGLVLGLCAGMGRHLGLDPLILRFALVALMFLAIGGLSVPLIYLLFALFVPVEKD